MTAQIWDFTLTVRVDDPEQLLKAALAHEDAESLTREDFLEDDGSIDINACLVVLLDPGSLPGCDIYGSETEITDVHEIDFGDERN